MIPQRQFLIYKHSGVWHEYYRPVLLLLWYSRTIPDSFQISAPLPPRLDWGFLWGSSSIHRNDSWFPTMSRIMNQNKYHKMSRITNKKSEPPLSDGFVIWEFVIRDVLGYNEFEGTFVFERIGSKHWRTPISPAQARLRDTRVSENDIIVLELESWNRLFTFGVDVRIGRWHFFLIDWATCPDREHSVYNIEHQFLNKGSLFL